MAKWDVERARGRARRRKSPWNLLLVPTAIFGWGAAFFVLFWSMWRFHVWMYPDHAGRFGDFWRDGIGPGAFVSSFLLVIPLLAASLPIGLMLANATLRVLPPARRVLESEAKGYPGTNFREATIGLWRVCRIALPIGLALSFIGALTLTSLR